MPKDNQKNINNVCFSCENPVIGTTFSINTRVNLPVCDNCKDSDKERTAEQELLKSLAEDFVCGCI